MDVAALQREVIRPRSGRLQKIRITLIVATAVSLGIGIQVVGTRTIRCFGESKADIARAVVKKYAYEAYPQWSAVHPGQPCPRSLDQLNEFMSSRDTKDPWGNRYRMFCLPDMPPGMRPIGVMSDGEDAKQGTQDDIKSWEPR
jgi:hypothetical protein